MKKKRLPNNIRKALGEGKIRLANKLLKETYSIRGEVVKGQQLGRTLGFPTANLKLIEEYPVFLANGVYAVKVRVEDDDRLINGMANIGIRPTLDQHVLTIEVNLFDFDSSIYSKEIEVFFIERMRDEQKFPGLAELKAQISQDKITAQEILAQLGET